MEIYNLTGIESISYLQDESRYIISGSSDMFFILPHLVSVNPDEIYPDYLFNITSLGHMNIGDIEKSYIFYDKYVGLADDENFSPNFLPYSYNLNFLIDSQANFEDNLRFEFLKQNIDDFSFTFVIRSFSDLEILLEFIMEENVIYKSDLEDYLYSEIPSYDYVCDLKNYDIHICLDRYKENSEMDKNELIKVFTLLFKTVYFYSDAYILRDNLGYQEYLDFISDLRENGVDVNINYLEW